MQETVAESCTWEDEELSLWAEDSAHFAQFWQGPCLIAAEPDSGFIHEADLPAISEDEHDFVNSLFAEDPLLEQFLQGPCLIAAARAELAAEPDSGFIHEASLLAILKDEEDFVNSLFAEGPL